MVQLVRIGNSQGIRIPKAFIEQADLEGKKLKLEVFKDGLLVSHSKKPREGWKEAIEATIKTYGQETPDSEWLDAPLTSHDK